MKAGWKTVKLGDVAAVFDGPHATPKTVEAGPIFLGIGALEDGTINLGETRHVTAHDFRQWTRRIRPQTDDIVFSYETRLGQAAIIPEGFECCLGRRMGLVRIDGERVVPRFFLYQYIAPPFREFLSGRTIRGATVDRLSIKEFPSFPIAFPPLSEQHRIVRMLDEAFDGIATAKVTTEKNLRNARALFESRLQSIFIRRAAGWVEKRLGDVGKTQYGLSEPMNEEGKGFKIFRMGEVQDGRLIDTGRMKFADIDRAQFEKCKLQPGDVLFNRTNSFELVGKTGIFDLPGAYCFASYLVRVILDKKVMLPEFLNYFMNSEGFQTSVKQKASKSINQANINATILSNESVRFPVSLSEQRSIVTRLNSLRQETKRLESIYQLKLATLDALKKSLLHQAFTGQL
jgi:restriction endonuclease S subunit